MHKIEKFGGKKMNKRNGTRSLLLPITGIVVISMILTISLYWIVIKVFEATAEPIEQNIPTTTTVRNSTTTETTTVIQTTSMETTTIIQTTSTETTTVQTTVQTTTEEATTTDVTTTTTEEVTSEIEIIESEPILTRDLGLIEGPSGNETWYNLNMDGVIQIMYEAGYEYQYWIREDGVKMFGQYIMCAADLELHPRGTLVETSLGMGIVCDTGTFTYEDPHRIDIAVTW